MIILAALLSTGQVLPLLDRKWLNDQVRLEAAVFGSPKRPLTLPAAPHNFRKFDNTNGM